MLTKKQHELLCYISDHLGKSGVSPSFEEMKEALDLKSKSGVHRLISALEERGFIRRLPNRARALEVLKTPEAGLSGGNVVRLKTPERTPVAANDIMEIPLHGRIAAGTPIEALQGTESLAVPADLRTWNEHEDPLGLVGSWLRELGTVPRTFVLATVAVPIVIYGVMPHLHRARARLLTRNT